MASFDFSVDNITAAPKESGAPIDIKSLIDESSLGTRARNGLYEIKDWEFSKQSDKETDDLVSRALQKSSNATEQTSPGSIGALSSLFSRLTGSKILTQNDIRSVLDGMQQHLMKKNVAKEIAERICEGVGEGLVGKKVGSFQSQWPCFFKSNQMY